MPSYGDLYWDVEEASFLRVTQDVDRLYIELQAVVLQFLAERTVDVSNDLDELTQALRYQRARIPCQTGGSDTHLSFDHNFPEYFDTRFGSHPVALQRKAQWMKLSPTEWNRDGQRFAKETILWGRKSGTMLVKHEFGDSQEAVAAVNTPHAH